jgi:hypothetical protein
MQNNLYICYMETTEKIELNKKIRAYNGDNDFLLSLKRSLNSKWCKKIEIGNKSYKILTDKQYEAAKSSL